MADRQAQLCESSQPETIASCGGQAPALLQVRLSYGVAPGSQKADTPLRSRPIEGRFGQFQLSVDFVVTKRRNVLFGASGAGKSTVLRLLAGLLQPSAATIRLGTRTLTDTATGIALPAGRRGIGYLTQEPALFPHLSVEDNIAFGLDTLERDARHARVSAMLALFSLQALARRMPLRLSGGERHRVALARAIAPRPSLLLLDEPFAGLDAALREKTIAALDRYLETSETTVITVSHDVAEVYASGAEVLLLERGRIAAQGHAHLVLASQRERLLRLLDATPPDPARSAGRS